MAEVLVAYSALGRESGPELRARQGVTPTRAGAVRKAVCFS